MWCCPVLTTVLYFIYHWHIIEIVFLYFSCTCIWYNSQWLTYMLLAALELFHYAEGIQGAGLSTGFSSDAWLCIIYSVPGKWLFYCQLCCETSLSDLHVHRRIQEDIFTKKKIITLLMTFTGKLLESFQFHPTLVDAWNSYWPFWWIFCMS